MNLVATHYNCTSPMDYISHHALHSHPPLHQSHSCHHSIISLDCLTTPAPHSHTHTHTHTFKQHSHMHSPRSLVWPRLTFWAFPLYSVSLCLPGLPIYSDRLLPAFWLCLPFDILSVYCLPRPLHCPCFWFCLACVTPVIASDPCLFDLALLFIKAVFGS